MAIGKSAIPNSQVPALDGASGLTGQCRPAGAGAGEAGHIGNQGGVEPRSNAARQRGRVTATTRSIALWILTVDQDGWGGPVRPIQIYKIIFGCWYRSSRLGRC